MHTLRRHPRQWSVVAWLFVTGVTTIVGLFTYLVLQGPINKSASSQILIGNDISREFDIQYPVLHVPEVDTFVKTFASQQTESFLAKIKDRSYDSGNKLIIHYSIPHHGEKLLSIVFSVTEEIVGSPPTTVQYRQVFDVASGKKLTLSDLFRDDIDPRSVLADIFYDYFSQQPGILPREQLGLLDFTFAAVEDLIVYEDSLLLFFNPHSLGAKQDSQSVLLQKPVVASLLKNAYSGKDTGRKLDTPPENVAYAINDLPQRHIPNANGGKRIALTFDDGPSPHTKRLLDILGRYRSRGTFYVLGHLAQPYAGDLQRMVQGGHEIGNHTWMHANLTQITSAEFDWQVAGTQHAIQQATGGYTPRTIRPPYGATNGSVTGRAAQLGLKEVLWNVDTNDWQARDGQLIYDRIMGGAADGRVILLHDIYGSSVDGAIRAVPELLAQGYQLVTVSELYGY